MGRESREGSQRSPASRRSKPSSKRTRLSTNKAPREPSREPNKPIKEREYHNMDIWHGLLPNDETAFLVREDGDFLMRAIEKDQVYNIVLSVRSGKEVLNAAVVEKSGGGFEFQDHVFETIKDIVDFYQVRKRPLNICGTVTTLERPIRRKKWELRHRMVTLGKELGAGSYGTVYKGTLQPDHEKPFQVAVKVLTEMLAEASYAVWKEARNHRTLDHPNVVKMYGIANDYLPYYLVMELVPGGSVDRFLEKKGAKLGIPARVQILIDAAAGLNYLHSMGLLHRDIACRNLLIDKVVKVADFGMSRRSTNYKVDPNKPMNLRWLAPEVYEAAVVNKSTDVYAFGVTMYEAFTVPYSIPYADWKPNKVYDMVVNKGHRLEPPKNMPRMIADLMSECLGPEKERPSFKTVLFTLRAYLIDTYIHERELF